MKILLALWSLAALTMFNVARADEAQHIPVCQTDVLADKSLLLLVARDGHPCWQRLSETSPANDDYPGYTINGDDLVLLYVSRTRDRDDFDPIVGMKARRRPSTDSKSMDPPATSVILERDAIDSRCAPGGHYEALGKTLARLRIDDTLKLQFYNRAHLDEKNLAQHPEVLGHFHIRYAEDLHTCVWTFDIGRGRRHSFAFDDLAADSSTGLIAWLRNTVSSKAYASNSTYTELRARIFKLQREPDWYTSLVRVPAQSGNDYDLFFTELFDTGSYSGPVRTKRWHLKVN